MKALWNGTVIAESDAPASICPWKGEATEGARLNWGTNRPRGKEPS